MAFLVGVVGGEDVASMDVNGDGPAVQDTVNRIPVIHDKCS